MDDEGIEIRCCLTWSQNMIRIECVAIAFCGGPQFSLSNAQSEGR